MNTTNANQSSIEIKPVSAPSSKPSQAAYRIAKIERRQAKLNVDLEKAITALKDEKRAETIRSGNEAILRAINELDHTTREMVVSTLLGATGETSVQEKILAWLEAVSDDAKSE